MLEIDVTPGELLTVQTILRQFIVDREVWAFGSRVRWTARQTSDLDLAIVGERPLPVRTLAALRGAFENSNLRFKVDVVDAAALSQAFRAIIDREHVVVYRPRGVSPERRDWPVMELGEIVRFLSGGTPSKARAENWVGRLPWASAKDMREFFITDTEDHLSEVGAAEATRVVEPGTTLLLVRGMTLLHDVPICVAKARMAFNQDIKAVVSGKNSIDPAIVPYLLLALKPALLNAVDLAGHGTGRLATSALERMPVVIPPLAEQRSIASVLGNLDEKIDLNARMNRTLEAMARALFRSWFVDFDPVRAKMEGRPTGLPDDTAALFPERLVETPGGEVPEGWRVASVGDLVTLHRDAINPGDSPDETFDHFSLPAYDERKLPAPDLGSSIKSNKTVVTPDSVLVSKLNPRIPRVWLPVVDGERRAVASTEFFVARPNPGVDRAFLYCAFGSSEFCDVLASRVTGTSGSHQRVKPEDFLALNVVIPPPPVMTAFTRIADPLLTRVAANLRQSQTLTALRDTLLPKLLSGEVRVPLAAANSGTGVP